MDLDDYFGLNSHLIAKFENLLSESKNNKQELKKILRPKRNISLFYNAVKNNSDFAAYLIRFAIENDVDSSFLLGSGHGNATLHAALRNRDCKSVEMILKYATDHGRRNAVLLKPHFSSCIGETPLQMAMRIGDIQSINAIFRFGLDNGLDAHKLLGLEKRNPAVLRCAIHKRTCYEVLSAIVSLATDNGVTADLLFRADGKGWTPLHLASFEKFEVVNCVIKLARECGISAKSLIGPDETGNSPLHYAATESCASSVEAILNFAMDSGVEATSLFHPNDSRRTPLHCAAMNESQNHTFNTLLSWAISNGVPLHPLLKADLDGRTPLHFLTRNLVKVSDDAKVAKNIVQMTHVIIQTEFDKEIIKTLLAPDEGGDTPLHLAFDSWSDSTYTAEAIMRFALENGVDWKKFIDIKDAKIRLKLKRIFYNQIISEPWIWPTLFPSQSRVVLRCLDHARNSNRSELNRIYSDPLPDDVLFQIFEYLDPLDLKNCEMVCHSWRDVLSQNIIWSKLHSRKSKHCKTYRRFQKIVELEDERFLHYGSSEKGKIISKILQDLDNNWKTGNYQMKTKSWDQDCNVRFKNDDDYLLAHCRTKSAGHRFKIIKRRSMTTERELNRRFRRVSDFQIHRNIIVIATKQFIIVFDATTAKQVNEIVVPNNWRVASLRLGHGLLVALSESSPNPPKSRQLTVWRVNSCTDIEHLVDLSIAGDEDDKMIKKTNVAMDERYIAVSLETHQSKKVYFVSTESWKIMERSLTITDTESRIHRYHRGRLIIQRKNCIRLSDVWTKDCRKINLKPFGLSSTCTQIGANSKYLVVMNGQEELTKVGIYYLNADGETPGCNTPLCCFDVPFEVKFFEMDETELICVGVNPETRLVVIDFLSTPSIKETNGDSTSWPLTLAKEIKETLT